MIRLRRTVLYVPADKPRALEKAAGLLADAVIIDLEDAVSPDNKDAARAAAVTAAGAIAASGKEVAIRINGIDTPWYNADITEVRRASVSALVLPKVKGAMDVKRVALRSGLCVWPMLETPQAVLDAKAVAEAAATTGPSALILGTNDLCADVGFAETPGREALAFTFQLVALAARAAGVDAIDGVLNVIDDDERLREEAQQVQRLGFAGKTVIHPAQVRTVNQVFSPRQEAIEAAERVVAAMREAERDGRAVATLDGRMVESLHARAAARLLATAAAIADRTAAAKAATTGGAVFPAAGESEAAAPAPSAEEKPEAEGAVAPDDAAPDETPDTPVAEAASEPDPPAAMRQPLPDVFAMPDESGRAQDAPERQRPEDGPAPADTHEPPETVATAMPTFAGRFARDMTDTETPDATTDEPDNTAEPAAPAGGGSMPTFAEMFERDMADGDPDEAAPDADADEPDDVAEPAAPDRQASTPAFADRLERDMTDAGRNEEAQPASTSGETPETAAPGGIGSAPASADRFARDMADAKIDEPAWATDETPEPAPAGTGSAARLAAPFDQDPAPAEPDEADLDEGSDASAPVSEDAADRSDEPDMPDEATAEAADERDTAPGADAFTSADAEAGSDDTGPPEAQAAADEPAPADEPDASEAEIAADEPHEAVAAEDATLSPPAGENDRTDEAEAVEDGSDAAEAGETADRRGANPAMDEFESLFGQEMEELFKDRPDSEAPRGHREDGDAVEPHAGEPGDDGKRTS